MATKQVVALPAKKKSQSPDAETAEKETFLARADNLCRHVAARRSIETVGELYESITYLLHQIASLFAGIVHIEGGSGDEPVIDLCDLGQDLVKEGKRRVHRLYDQVSLLPAPGGAQAPRISLK
jgi:hypothetical protein